tara:strand:+ start:701 stop:886 length:186 start_codon:yes stop_codon:yes gene_type:complete
MSEKREKMKVDEALNLLVSITRQVKMTYDEHKLVEQAVDVVLENVNANKQRSNQQSKDKSQ